MLRAHGTSRQLGSIALVGAACAAGGVLGGTAALRYCSARRGPSLRELSPRRAATLILAVGTLVALALLVLAWPEPATAKGPGLKSIACGAAGLGGLVTDGISSMLGAAAGCGSSGGAGAAGILSGLAHALPKLIPVLLAGVLGWFVGTQVLGGLLTGVLGLLVHTPKILLTQGSPAALLEQHLTMVAFGALASIVTMSILWHWAAGMFELDGGQEALRPLTRGLGAIVAIPVWEFAVPQLIGVGNDVSGYLVSQGGGDGSVLGTLLGLGGASGATGLLAKGFSGFKGFGLGMLIVLIAVLALLLLLLALKVVVTAAAVLLFIAFPLAMTVWPVRRLAWIAEAIVEAFVVTLLIPIGWALILATSGAVAGTFGVLHGGHVSGYGSLAGALLAPMVAIVLLWMLVALPRQLIHLALLQTVSRRGPVADAGYRVARGRVQDWMEDRLPERVGGTSSGRSPRAQSSPLPAHQSRLAHIGANVTGNGNGAAELTSAAGIRDALTQLDRAQPTTFREGLRHGWREARAQRTAGPVTDADGFAVAAPDQRHVEQGVREAQDTQRLGRPPTGVQIAHGVRELPQATRRAVEHAHDRLGPEDFQRQMVRQSLSDAHLPRHQDTFRMLAAADWDTVSKALIALQGPE